MPPPATAATCNGDGKLQTPRCCTNSRRVPAHHLPLAATSRDCSCQARSKYTTKPAPPCVVRYFLVVGSGAPALFIARTPLSAKRNPPIPPPAPPPLPSVLVLVLIFPPHPMLPSPPLSPPSHRRRSLLIHLDLCSTPPSFRPPSPSLPRPRRRCPTYTLERPSLRARRRPAIQNSSPRHRPEKNKPSQPPPRSRRRSLTAAQRRVRSRPHHGRRCNLQAVPRQPQLLAAG